MAHILTVTWVAVAAFVVLGIFFFVFFDKLVKRILGDRHNVQPGKGFQRAAAAGYAPLRQFQGAAALGRLRNPQVGIQVSPMV